MGSEPPWPVKMSRPTAVRHSSGGSMSQKMEVYKRPGKAGKRSALVRERRAEVSEAEEDLERTKEEVGVRIVAIYNKLETTRAMVEVAREDLAARQENARLSDEQFKRGV